MTLVLSPQHFEIITHHLLTSLLDDEHFILNLMMFQVIFLSSTGFKGIFFIPDLHFHYE